MPSSSLPPPGSWWPHRAGASAELPSRQLEAGFSSGATDHTHRRVDVGDLLAPHPNETFYVRAAGPQQHDGGVKPGDILVVDRLLRPWDRALVVASVDGDIVTRHVRMGRGRAALTSEVVPGPPRFLYDRRHRDDHPAHPDAQSREPEATLWGVVTWVLHRTVSQRTGRTRRIR